MVETRCLYTTDLYCCTLCSSSHDLPKILRREKLRDGHGSGDSAEEAVGLLLVVDERAEKLLHLHCWRLKGGELLSQLVHRHDLVVALPLVPGQGLVQWLLTAETCIDSPGQQLGVAESICDPLRRDRIFVVTCVTYKCLP